jgi:hypothetical protein
MAKDFQSSQISTSQIIASRSLSTLPSIVFISSSNADGVGGITPPLGAGPDVFFFVSGSKSNDAYASFGGSVKVSGSLIVQEGLTGSLQVTAGGLPYLVAGTNITLSTASNGQITINSSGGGGGAPTDAQYLVLSANGTLTDERVVTVGTGLSSSDGGAGGSFLLTVDDSVVATISGSTFTGAVKFNQGLSGSLTRLVDGSSYLIAGSNVTITSSSNGAVTISSSGGSGTPSTPTDSIQFNNAGSFGGSSNLRWVDGTSDLYLTGALRANGNTYISGAAYYNSPGTDYYIYVNDNDAVITLEDQVNGVNAEISANAGVPSLSLNDVGGFGLSANVVTAQSVANLAAYGPIDFNIDSDQSLIIGSGSATDIKIGATGTPTVIGDQLTVYSTLNVTGSIIPGLDITYNLGSPSKRWANVYTGDLHLRNERGHWTIVEEAEFLCVVNNLTGKKYKMMLEPLPE